MIITEVVRRLIMGGTQKRHWLHTVQAGHLGLNGDENDAAFEAAMEVAYQQLERDERLRYACAQAERGEEGHLHFQVYTEWKTSLRRAQVVKALPSHAEHRQGTRRQARKYCMKADTRVYTLPDLGTWRPERGDDDFGQVEGPKARALRYLTSEGLTPLEIAALDPECYFTFHRAIHETWKALQGLNVLPPAAGTLDSDGEEE